MSEVTPGQKAIQIQILAMCIRSGGPLIDGQKFLSHWLSSRLLSHGCYSVLLNNSAVISMPCFHLFSIRCVYWFLKKFEIILQVRQKKVSSYRIILPYILIRYDRLYAFGLSFILVNFRWGKWDWMYVKWLIGKNEVLFVVHKFWKLSLSAESVSNNNTK